MSPLALLVLVQAAAEHRAEDGLTAFSLAFMLLAMGAATALAGWCFKRILTGKRHFDPDGTGPAHSPVQGKVEREQQR